MYTGCSTAGDLAPISAKWSVCCIVVFLREILASIGVGSCVVALHMVGKGLLTVAVHM